MKLYYLNTSPYSRKVRLCARELGLESKIKEQLVLPLANPEALHAATPIGKIPALALSGQDDLFDSPLICRYLDSLSAEKSLIPDDDGQWQVLRLEALADGMTDAAFNLVMEKLRPVEQQSAMWQQRWQEAIARSLNELEQNLPKLDKTPDLAHLASAAALSYLNLRLPDALLADNHPACIAWLDTFSQRPSMQATVYIS